MRANTSGDEPIDELCLKLPAAYAVEVYEGERGHVVIKQDDPMGDEAAAVLLLPVQARIVAAHLVKLAELIEREGRG